MTTFDRRAFLRAAGLAGLTVGFGSTLTACGSGSGTTTGGSGASSTGALSGTATFTTWATDAEAAAFKQIAADFKAARGADVTIEVLPYDQIRTVVDRRLQANDAPDMFRVSYTDVGQYAQSGALADLSGSMDAAFGDAFLPALWSAVQSDGRPFGVPHHTDTSGLVYNKGHFERAGITSVPATLEEAWTWDEFVEVLQQLKAANLGAAPFAFNYQAFGAFRWFNTLYQGGGTVLDDSLQNVTLDTPQARRALEWTKDLYTQGLHEPSVLVKRPTYPDEIFPTEKISMIQVGSFLVSYLEENIADKFEWGVTYLPQDAGAATDLGGNAVVVTDGAKNPEVATEFVKYLVTKENMQRFCEETTVLPVRKDLADAELAYAVRPDLLPVFQKQATTVPDNLVKAVTSPYFAGMNQALIDNLDQYFGDAASSTDTVVAGLTSSITEALRG